MTRYSPLSPSTLNATHDGDDHAAEFLKGTGTSELEDKGGNEEAPEPNLFDIDGFQQVLNEDCMTAITNVRHVYEEHGCSLLIPSESEWSTKRSIEKDGGCSEEVQACREAVQPPLLKALSECEGDPSRSILRTSYVHIGTSFKACQTLDGQSSSCIDQLPETLGVDVPLSPQSKSIDGNFWCSECGLAIVSSDIAVDLLDGDHGGDEGLGRRNTELGRECGERKLLSGNMMGRSHPLALWVLGWWACVWGL